MSDATETAAPTPPIPTDPYELAEVLRPLDYPDRFEVAHRLEGQLGDPTRAGRLFDDAEGLLRREFRIGQGRRDLHRFLADARHAINAARDTINRLAGPEIYDVEYAEGAQAADMLAYLDDVSRDLRAVTALNPCPTEDDQ